METLAVQAEALSGILDKYRLLAPLLSRGASVIALFSGETANAAEAARRKAIAIASMSGAKQVAFFYPDGRVLASAGELFTGNAEEHRELLEAVRQGRLGRQAISLVIVTAYVMWRGNEGITRVPAHLMAGLPVWGRNLMLMGRNSLTVFFNEDTRKVMVDTSKTTIMLMFIIVNALLFAHVLTGERIPQAITDLMLDAGFTWFTFLTAVNILLLIGGQFMEPSGLLLIVAPVVFPIATELGVDPVHLGIIMVVNMGIGMITPPIGLNLFVTSGITGMSLIQVVKAALPFVAVLFVFLILVT